MNATNSEFRVCIRAATFMGNADYADLADSADLLRVTTTFLYRTKQQVFFFRARRVDPPDPLKFA